MPRLQLALLFLARFVAALPQGSTQTEDHRAHCRYLPQDPEWPSQDSWHHLNQSVHGRLIAGQPMGRVCHGDTYDYAACAALAGRWNAQAPFFRDPVNVMSTYWKNDSCTPFTSPSSTCSLGNLASYAINVTSAEDVSTGIAFAKRHNIRVQVKNTGHDFLGRSTGQGSLALWTHNLKSVEFLNYTSPHYTGPAVKMGAGIQAFEAYPQAAAHGLRIVGGYCPTVGIAGGYLQGAGHGPLMGTYGMAADNTLEVEAVTVDGRHIVASPTQNEDLFWAVNGGGGGTYAVVLSVTTRAHQDGPVAGATFSIGLSAHQTADSWWDVVSIWHQHLVRLHSLPGFTCIWRVTNTTLDLFQATYADHTQQELETELFPFFNRVKDLGFTLSARQDGSPTYYDHFVKYTPNLPFGTYVNNETVGGRLISRDSVETNLPGVIEAIRQITSTGAWVNGITGSASHERVGNAPGDNAVLPAWRGALYHLVIEMMYKPDITVEQLAEKQAEMNHHQDLLRAASPGGGAYINEATYDNAHWKEEYFGANYDKLLEVKEKFDSHFVLYGPASVGSDKWERVADGRLCKK